MCFTKKSTQTQLHTVQLFISCNMQLLRVTVTKKKKIQYLWILWFCKYFIISEPAVNIHDISWVQLSHLLAELFQLRAIFFSKIHTSFSKEWRMSENWKFKWEKQKDCCVIFILQSELHISVYIKLQATKPSSYTSDRFLWRHQPACFCVIHQPWMNLYLLV